MGELRNLQEVNLEEFAKGFYPFDGNPPHVITYSDESELIAFDYLNYV